LPLAKCAHSRRWPHGAFRGSLAGPAFRRGLGTYARRRPELGHANGRDIWRFFGKKEGCVRSSSFSCIDLNLVVLFFDAATIGENRIARGYARLFE